MDDLISRSDAIGAVKEERFPIDSDYAEGFMAALDKVEWILKEWLPSAQADSKETSSTHKALDTISRKAAIDAVISLCDNCNSGNCGACLVNFPGMRDCKKVLEELPSAQPEIVRCKDCKYWMPHSQLGFDEDNGTYHDYCAKLVPEDEYYAFYRNADDFCSRAERKTDDTD